MTAPTPNQFTHLMHRLGLDEPSAADYLGVPVFTFRKWASGERQPSAAVLRLLDVLGTVEALAPALHAGFLPAHVDKVRVKPKRHVEKVPASPSLT
jgi:hypothetical protein